MKQWPLTGSACAPLALPGRAIMAQSMKKGAAEAMAEEKKLFWQLLASLEKKLFNFLHKALNFSEDSADLYQEVVIRAWRYFPSFDRRRSFSSWIFAIAYNEIKKHFNKRKEDQAVIPLASLAVEPAAPSAEDPAVGLIYGAARQLPLRQREIFFLFYYNRFSIAEIAAICGLRQGNVKFILSRGREAVRLTLEANDEK
jgi:RNA polymerase sigma-70 factor (ECF subfamily)